MNALDQLAESFSRLPGIGKKSAMRISNHLLKADQVFLENFAKQLVELHSRIHQCSECGSYTETDPCQICTNPLRERNLMCVVEQPQDVNTIENSGEFRGIFHVLGALISPLEGIGPDQLPIGKLIDRIKKENVTEVIIATNPDVEGEATAMYISKLLKPFDIRVSRIAQGISMGSELEYADEVTLSKALSDRKEI